MGLHYFTISCQRSIDMSLVIFHISSDSAYSRCWAAIGTSIMMRSATRTDIHELLLLTYNVCCFFWVSFHKSITDDMVHELMSACILVPRLTPELTVEIIGSGIYDRCLKAIVIIGLVFTDAEHTRCSLFSQTHFGCPRRQSGSKLGYLELEGNRVFVIMPLTELLFGPKLQLQVRYGMQCV
jgi:hypothetical protein